MVEGDASMASYVDAEGKPKQALNITQRMSLITKLQRRHTLTDMFQATWRFCAAPTTLMPGLRESKSVALPRFNVESVIDRNEKP